jgi:hypothetical protein
MLNYKVNTHGGSTNTAVAPPNAITPEQVIPHHREAQERNGWKGTVPSFIVPVLCISYLNKRNLQSHFFLFFIQHVPQDIHEQQVHR